jgi:hypothetical protein
MSKNIVLIAGWGSIFELDLDKMKINEKTYIGHDTAVNKIKKVSINYFISCDSNGLIFI